MVAELTNHLFRSFWMITKMNVVNREAKQKKAISSMNILKHRRDLVGNKMPPFLHLQIVNFLTKVKLLCNRSLMISLLDEQPTEGPSVDPNALNNDASSKSLDPKKSSISQRRAPQAKKVGMKFSKFINSIGMNDVSFV